MDTTEVSFDYEAKIDGGVVDGALTPQAEREAGRRNRKSAVRLERDDSSAPERCGPFAGLGSSGGPAVAARI